MGWKRVCQSVLFQECWMSGRAMWLIETVSKNDEIFNSKSVAVKSVRSLTVFETEHVF